MLPVASVRKNTSPCAAVGVPALTVTDLVTVTLVPTPMIPEMALGVIESASAGVAGMTQPSPARTHAASHRLVILLRPAIVSLLAGTPPALHTVQVAAD
jgi:hypothetical protein